MAVRNQTPIQFSLMNWLVLLTIAGIILLAADGYDKQSFNELTFLGWLGVVLLLPIIVYGLIRFFLGGFYFFKSLIKGTDA